MTRFLHNRRQWLRNVAGPVASFAAAGTTPLAWPKFCQSAEVRPWPYVHAQPPFRFHADFDLRPYSGLLEELSSLQREMQTQLHIAPARETIDVYVFRLESTYRHYLRTYFPELSMRRAMFVKTTGPGNVFAHFSNQFGTDLRHECTHALLHATLPMVPLWLDEGLAEYYEVPASQRAFDNPHLASLRRQPLWDRPSAMEKLEQVRQFEAMGGDQYRDAWSWVHFMLHGNEAALWELRSFLGEIQNRVPPEPLSQRLAARIPNLMDAYKSHLRHWRRS
ncbi:MAG: hypothetical protein R3E01_23730 [Pirellulaceae bacterium]|nr:hypothetical protein [Planctomycetales bacterium]